MPLNVSCHNFIAGFPSGADFNLLINLSLYSVKSIQTQNTHSSPPKYIYFLKKLTSILAATPKKLMFLILLHNQNSEILPKQSTEMLYLQQKCQNASES